MSESEKIKQELLQVGIFVNSVYDLVNTKEKYPEAIPILLNALEQGISDKRIKEGVIRALTVKEAKGAGCDLLLKEFYKCSENESSIRWAIGNAFQVIATSEFIPELIKIVKNKAYGKSRQMFVMTLGKLKARTSEETLIQLLKDNDNDILSHVIWALGAIKSVSSETLLLPFLNHENSNIRGETKKALEKIKKAKGE